MNCDELRKDIAAIKSSCSTMQEKYDHMNKTGTSGKADFVESRIAAEKLVDEILEKYLPDFAEKNPEFFDWQFNQELRVDDLHMHHIQYCENGDILCGGMGSVYRITQENGAYEINTLISGIEGVYEDLNLNFKVSMKTIVPFKKTIIVGGDETLCSLGKNKNGDWVIAEKYEKFRNEEGKRCRIGNIIKLPERGILISGNDGMLWRCEQNLNGKLDSFEQITGFKDNKGKLEYIDDMQVLPDGSALIGGGRALYRYSKNQDTDVWELTNEAQNYFHGQTVPIIHDIIKISSHKLLIGGWDNDDIYEYEIASDGTPKLIGKSNLIKRFDVESEESRYLDRIFPVSDNQILALIEKKDKDFNSTYHLYACEKEGDKWALTQRIDEFNEEKDDNGKPIDDNRIKDIAVLPNGNIMIAKWNGSVAEYTHRPSSVEGLKDALDKIISKGE